MHPVHPAGRPWCPQRPAAGDTGAPVAYFIDFGIPLSVNQVAGTFSFDLNSGKVTLSGSFPNLPSSLDFTVEFDQRFQGAGGYNILFHSGKTSDHAGYLIAVQHVAATG